MTTIKKTSYVYRCKLWLPNIWRADFDNKIKRIGCYFLYKHENVQDFANHFDYQEYIKIIYIYIYIYYYLVESIYPIQELR